MTISRYQSNPSGGYRSRQFVLAVIVVLCGICSSQADNVLDDQKNDFLDDLSINSVHAVKSSEIGHIIGSDAYIPIVQNEEQDVFFKVNVTTKTDIHKYIMESKFAPYILSVDAKFCSKNDFITRLTTLKVYKNGKIIKANNINDNDKYLNGARSDGRYNYDIAIFGKLDLEWEIDPGRVKRNGQKFHLRYNLLNKLEDICIRLYVYNMGKIFYSNEVRVTRKHLSQALVQYQK